MAGIVGRALAGWRRAFSRVQRGPEEPARAIEGAMKRLRRLSAGGVRVPDDITRAVLAADQACIAGDGVVDVATGLAFFDASARLATIAARMGDEVDVPMADAFSRAAVNSEFMLKYASESGTAVPAEVQADLVAVQMEDGRPRTEAARVKFYSAYAVLAKLLGDVTADTIKACRSPRTRRALRKDERRAIGWALLTVVISVVLFTAAAIDKQLLDDIATANELAIKLRGRFFRRSIRAAWRRRCRRSMSTTLAVR